MTTLGVSVVCVSSVPEKNGFKIHSLTRKLSIKSIIGQKIGSKFEFLFKIGYSIDF